MCSHQVLRGGSVNPKDTWCQHVLMSPGFNKMESAPAARGQKALGRRHVCVAAKRCSFIREGCNMARLPNM